MVPMGLIAGNIPMMFSHIVSTISIFDVVVSYACNMSCKMSWLFLVRLTSELDGMSLMVLIMIGSVFHKVFLSSLYKYVVFHFLFKIPRLFCNFGNCHCYHLVV